jgi:hypothetical protein
MFNRDCQLIYEAYTIDPRIKPGCIVKINVRRSSWYSSPYWDEENVEVFIL